MAAARTRNRSLLRSVSGADGDGGGVLLRDQDVPGPPPPLLGLPPGARGAGGDHGQVGSGDRPGRDPDRPGPGVEGGDVGPGPRQHQHVRALLAAVAPPLEHGVRRVLTRGLGVDPPVLGVDSRGRPGRRRAAAASRRPPTGSANRCSSVRSMRRVARTWVRCSNMPPGALTAPIWAGSPTSTTRASAAAARAVSWSRSAGGQHRGLVDHDHRPVGQLVRVAEEEPLPIVAGLHSQPPGHGLTPGPGRRLELGCGAGGGCERGDQGAAVHPPGDRGRERGGLPRTGGGGQHGDQVPGCDQVHRRGPLLDTAGGAGAGVERGQGVGVEALVRAEPTTDRPLDDPGFRLHELLGGVPVVGGAGGVPRLVRPSGHGTGHCRSVQGGCWSGPPRPGPRHARSPGRQVRTWGFSRRSRR